MGRKVDPLLLPVGQTHHRLADVELGKLARHPLEANHQLPKDRLLDFRQKPVERALCEPDAFLTASAQDLQPRRHRILEPKP